MFLVIKKSMSINYVWFGLMLPTYLKKITFKKQLIRSEYVRVNGVVASS